MTSSCLRSIPLMVSHLSCYVTDQCYESIFPTCTVVAFWHLAQLRIKAWIHKQHKYGRRIRDVSPTGFLKSRCEAQSLVASWCGDVDRLWTLGELNDASVLKWHLAGCKHYGTLWHLWKLTSSVSSLEWPQKELQFSVLLHWLYFTATKLAACWKQVYSWPDI